MTTHKPAKRPATSSPGMKLLIAAASIAATLGGWALISTEEKPPAVSMTPTPAAAAAEARVVKIKLQPLPTLVPAITSQPQVVMINRPRPVPRAAQPAAAPQAAPANELVLRDVSAPAVNNRSASASAPAPVANTGSSR